LPSAQLIEAQSLARDWTPGRIALHPVREVPTAGAARTTLVPPIGVPAAIPEEPNRTERTAQRPRWSAGTGFYVSRDGHLVTNEHVVRACRSVRLPDGQTVEVVGRDRRADLALLRARPVQAVASLRFNNQVRQGEDVLTYGFPLHGVLPSSGQLGAGMVTAVRGLRDNPLQLQIDVPVQSGNSGGPLIDQRGEVVGVVVSKLNALRVAQMTGDIPQNVNFAVRLEPLKALLEKYQVRSAGSPAQSPNKDRQTIAEEARRYTTVVLCERESAPGS
jgi:S1-C subfamily serine protease